MNSRRIGLYLKALAIICAGLVIISCNKKETNIRPDIVAQIGDHSITSKDFQLNYEFGFSHLKNGRNKKLSYLKKMISEKLLALEGYRLGLDKMDRVQQREKHLFEELLVEELLMKEVHQKIRIDHQEIMYAISKSNIQFKLKYWVEPSLESAVTVKALLQNNEDLNLTQEIVTKNSELAYNMDSFETDYLTWLDMPPDLLKEIKELEMGEISTPYKFDQVYLLLQVTDIKNGILSEFDYDNNFTKFKEILLSRKIKEKTALYVSQYLTPKEIVTKKTAFNLLANALGEWKNQFSQDDHFKNVVLHGDNRRPALQELKNNLNKILVSYNTGNWTLKDFIERFDPSAIHNNELDIITLKRELNHEIAFMIRSYLLSQEALAQRLDQSESLLTELNKWRDKWVYEELYQYLTHALNLTEDEIRKYYDDHLARYSSKKGNSSFSAFEKNVRHDAYLESRQYIMEQKVQLLKNDYTVIINQDILDTISVTEYEKSRWANLLIYKAGSGRQAIPVVDPQWSF